MSSKQRQVDANSINADVAASIMQSQSIVVPTMANQIAAARSSNSPKLNSNRSSPSSMSPSKNPYDTQASTNANMQTFTETGRNPMLEAASLEEIITCLLVNRKTFQPEAPFVTIDEIHQAIQLFTGKNWETNFQPIHDSLLRFLQTRSASFMVINNAFVTVNEMALPPPGLSNPRIDAIRNSGPNPMLSSSPSVNNASFDLATSDVWTEGSTSSLPMPTQPTYLAYSSAAPIRKSSYETSSSYMTPNPFDYHESVYQPPAANYQMPNKPYVPPKSNDDWRLFDDDDTMLNSSFSATYKNPFSPQSGKTDSFKYQQSNQYASNGGRSSVDESENDEEDEVDEDDDESFDGRDLGGGERVALTHAEVRELAENEIGKDNIRIMAGFSVVKFGREGRPHQRKMWINSALTHLAWESSQFDGSHRGLELSKVSQIRVGEMTPTIRRCTKDVKRVSNLCFSLEADSRTLDLQACSVIQRDSLAAALQKVIDFNHRHKPRRIDKYRTELTL